MQCPLLLVLDILFEGEIMGYSKRRQYKKNIRRSRKNDTKSKKKRMLISVSTYLVEILLVIGLAYSITGFGVMKTNMTGESMETTLVNGDSVFVNKLAYKFSKPQRNDVIAYCQNTSEHNYLTIKRIIGLPGEKIKIENGSVYINGELLEEKINVEPMNTGGLASEEMFLEEGEYFLLGDNRNNSQDSRFSNVGTIVSDDIIGKVWIKIEPFAFIDSLNLKNNDDVLKEGE